MTITCKKSHRKLSNAKEALYILFGDTYVYGKTYFKIKNLYDTTLRMVVSSWKGTEERDRRGT